MSKTTEEQLQEKSQVFQEVTGNGFVFETEVKTAGEKKTRRRETLTPKRVSSEKETSD